MQSISVERPKTLAFISYRRDDTRDWANLIAETLQREFGRSAVFIDTDGIRVGDKWQRKIEAALESATIIIPVIGPKWLFLQNPDDGQRRLDTPNDWVRREIEFALSEQVQMLPVTVSGAPIPPAQKLPPSIRDLPDRQILQITDKRDLDLIVSHLSERLGFKKINTELDFPTPVDKSRELSDDEVNDVLAHLPGWSVEQRDTKRGREGIAMELVTTLKFDGFHDAIHFMASAARYVSRTDHHPFWENQYKDLRIKLTTWDIGMRISAKDVKLASYLQWLYLQYTPGERPEDMPYTAGDGNRPG